MLNGESIQREKSEEICKDKHSPFDQKNMIYSGTSVLFGDCICVVQKIGDETEMGKIK